MRFGEPYSRRFPDFARNDKKRDQAKEVRDPENALVTRRDARTGGQPVLSGMSLLPFHEGGCLAIERGVIGVMWPQIKFVDNDVDERGRRHSQKNSE